MTALLFDPDMTSVKTRQYIVYTKKDMLFSELEARGNGVPSLRMPGLSLSGAYRIPGLQGAGMDCHVV